MLYGIRTGMLGVAMGTTALSLVVYRLRALPIIAAVYVAGILAVFAIPQNREYSLRNPSAVGRRQTSFSIPTMWIWTRSMITADTVDLGIGAALETSTMDRVGNGKCQLLFSTGVWDMKVVHNEYVSGSSATWV